MINITKQNSKNVNTFKLFSNPVSGIISNITTDVIPDLREIDLLNSISGIRYTYSMIIHALEFWRHKYSIYLEKIKPFDNNIFNHYPSRPVSGNLDKIHDLIQMIKNNGKGFLFSHGSIYTRSPKNNGELQQMKLIQKKYCDLNSRLYRPNVFVYTVKNPQPVIKIDVGFIHMIVFPNEHPYITRQRIKSVGITSKGNVYIINEKPVHNRT